jgi:murein DD-endopeptidase MepM/ murein hydrolase activator NlpD
MSKPANSSRHASILSLKFLHRLFPSRRGTEGTPTRGRQRTPINTISPRRRVRILVFSTWGSDYKQIDLSAKTFSALLFGVVLLISILAVLSTQALNRFVQAYRLASLTEAHQILRSRLNQTGTRVHNLSRRLSGSDAEEPFSFTQKGEESELPALLNPPDHDSTSRREGSLQTVVTKRGPLGLAWTEHKTSAAPDEKEPIFYGQGGGAFVDDEDNIYPTRLEKERVNPAAASAPAAAGMKAGIEPGSGNDMISQLEKDLSLTQELQQTIIEKFEIRRKQLEHIPSIKPLLSGRITDFFGKRVDPFVSRVRHHQGLDIGAPAGTEVFAPANGVIEFVKTTYRRNTGYGRAVVINHGYGVKTLYGHLSAIKVKAGQKIERWDIIGLVGETGRATGPHLHYEVWVDGEVCDPMRFILNN